MKNSRRALFHSIISLVLCFSMLIGTTYAWFTDTESSMNNIIQSGNLDIEMYWNKDLSSNWTEVEEDKAIFDYDKWEPGYTEVRYVKIVNEGNLAFKYMMNLYALGAVGKLADVIDVYYVENPTAPIGGREALSALTPVGVLSEVIKGLLPTAGQMEPDDEIIIAIALKMRESAGNEYMKESVGDSFTVQLIAAQLASENDAFGKDYDTDATFPEKPVNEGVTAPVENENGQAKNDVELNGTNASAKVPAGTKLEDGAKNLTLTVTDLPGTDEKVVVGEGETAKSFDVHIDGVASDNDKPIPVDLGEVAPKGMNGGNLKLTHMENGQPNAMTFVEREADLSNHNEFYYDPATGRVVVYLATFSEVAMVADNENAWEGKVAEDFSGGTGTETEPYIIANADQLAYFNECISNDNENYGDKHYKLVADINLGGEENANKGILFYPIGYHKVGNPIATVDLDDAPEFVYQEEDPDYARSRVSLLSEGDASTWYTSGGAFMGTFDGNGHTIGNIYQNTWQLKGNYSGNYWNAAMGLFGYVYGGTVKNLTVDNFSSDGEFTPTGVIAAYAAGNAKFENIAITKCNPRVYNTGNGGIIGIAGSTSEANDDHITLKNITVDNSNKISALWGSWDVACGGLVGMYRGNVDGSGNATGDTISFENCHVAAQIDVYNDVCANYQYYAYRYSGMIIGSVRHNTTSEGKTIPNMTGITANGCTVHFGTWNDYYYCEIIDNTTASYTHDYQMSRLVEIKAIDGTTITYLDGTTGTVPASGRANYVIVDYTKGHGTENATCCHFKNGEVWTHDMGGIQTGIDENGDGQDDLKEDKQHLYLEFNNLFTGYGWGVSSMAIDKWNGITKLDVTIGEQEKSVEKFEVIKSELTNNRVYKLDAIFDYLENCGIELVPSALTVSITNLDENGNVTAEINYDRDNWENSTIKFTSTGNVKITIQDYYFCTPTELTVEITERQPEVKFDVVMNNGDFLHRVGNSGTVALDKLFKAKEDAEIGTISVTVEAVNGTSASGTYSNNAIQFSGTGVVKVTVTDNDYCIPTELYLEVVDAYNVTQYSELKDQNSVFLSDITMSNGGTYRLTGNKVLYGNGFTFDVINGAYAGVEYDYASYVIYLENSRFDNIQINGAVYPKIGSTRSDDYNRAIVMTSGDCSITNSYISNGASPIRNGGNLELVNTTLKGGIYANLDLRNGHLILDNVTTINQIGANDKYNDSTEIVGMGIVVYQEGGSEKLKITIRNNLNQYNYLSKDQADNYLTNTYASQIKNIVFGNDFSDYQNGGWINFGIISMNNCFDAEDLIDERISKQGYFGKSKTVTILTESRDCYCYSFKPESITPPTYLGYEIVGQGVIVPNIEFDFTNKNYQSKTDGSNDYCYADGKTVYISMDEGDSVNWDTSILTATKFGKELEYTVKMAEVDYTGKSITFNNSGEYEIVYTFEDGYNYNMDNGQLSSFNKEYTEIIIIIVSVVKADAKHAVFSFGANGTAYSARSVAIGDKTYVMPDVTATVSGKIGSTTVSGTTVYYPITEMYTSDGKTAHTGSWYACFPIFKDAIQIIDYADKGTGDAVTCNQTNVTTVAGIPSTLKATNPTSAFLYSMNATNYPPPTDPTAFSGAVCYTCNRSGLTSSNTRAEMTVIAEYTYTDNAGTVYYYYIGYHCAAQTKGSTSPCVTPDTLVTLADGTQKRIDAVTYDDMLLVWDFVNGEYAVMPSIIVMNHGYDDYTVVKLKFEDGTTVNTINGHGFFDTQTNEFVLLGAENVAEYVGHDFVKVDGDGYTTTKLVDYTITNEYTESWSLLTAEHYNCILEDMWTITAAEVEDSPKWLMPFEVNDDMKYDADKMQADIEKYGLYTYDDFADYCTFEQFTAFNFPIFKVSVEKGYITWTEIEYLLGIHLAK